MLQYSARLLSPIPSVHEFAASKTGAEPQQHQEHLGFDTQIQDSGVRASA